jgi:iron complex outermembrane receptor protein
MYRPALLRGASACALILASLATAKAQVSLPQIVVGAAQGTPTPPPLDKANETVVTQKEIVEEKPPETDTAKLLEHQPGVSVQTGGGVSGLPAIRGLADDRLKIVVGGVQATSSCANHMNSPLSYTDPNTIGRVEVVTAVSSVSKGGDSIGGSILVTPKSPVFATPVVAPAVVGPGGAPVSPILAASPYPPVPYLPLPVPGTLRFGPNNEVLATGTVSAFFRGNNNGVGVSANINMANDHWSLLYNGSWQRATDYHAGGNGDKVLSTNFMSENHAVTLGYQNEGHLFTFRGAYQNIPYQGFPNQRMDMTRNRSYSLDALYKGAFEWGTLEARAYWHQVFHKMGFLEDRFWLNHPMIALGRDFGYSVKAEIPYSDQDLFRIGNEFHGYRLQDYWPSDFTGLAQGFATPPGTLSRPFANVNINGGQRNRFGTYVEWERRWTPQWSSLIGVRNDIVWMDTGPGQSYTPFIFPNSPLLARANNLAVNIFNAQNHARTDINFDMTALARYEPEPGSLYEFGYSRKTRSPNLYERYTWPVAGPFTAMFNWFGDGNGYTGNLNLKPEVAHNVAFTGAWRDMSGANNWEARISPFYTYVENYIDGARTGGTFNTFPVANSYIFQIMQFRNFNAELYGVDGSGRVKLHESPEYGRLQAVGVVSFVYGRNLDIGNPQYCPPGNGLCSVASFLVKKGDGLWNLMPANARIALEHQIGGLSMAAETQLVAPKDHVSANKGEFTTPAYALLNLRAAYDWSNMRIDLGVDNVTDALYSLPLGGFDLTNYSRNAFLFGRNAGLASVRQVPGMGRNFYAGLTVRF